MGYKEILKGLPNTPGVYMMKDGEGRVLYVGKAGNLKKRVSSYFQTRRSRPLRLEALVQKIKDIEHISTSTSAEALIYENSLIKKLSPRYNVALKDGKSYPILKLTVNEKFPRLFITREKKDDGAAYYGPYTDARLLREAVNILRRLFPLRTCNKMPKALCLNYHISQCAGPCVGKTDESEYGKTVSELKLFLDGKRSELLSALSERMQELAKGEHFEEAERIRKRIETLGAVKDNRIGYDTAASLNEMGGIFGMKRPPEAIEAFDVSDIMGVSAVGSMISFYKGRPRKSDYRRFKIKSVHKIDDYAMIRELIRRRYERRLRESGAMPDLILIDGGKGHLSVALDELNRLGISDIPVAAITKPARLDADIHRSGGEFEHIYLKDRVEPIVLPRESKTLHLLKRIRDEAHRFAITYHKKLLSKKVRISELDNIPGIGKKRKKILLSRMWSIDRVKTASLEDLLKMDGIDEKTAKNIIAYFKGRGR